MAKILTIISFLVLMSNGLFSQESRQNAAVLDYCRTSMSALAGATAGIVGLTGLYGFIFYFLMSFTLSVSVLVSRVCDYV